MPASATWIRKRSARRRTGSRTGSPTTSPRRIAIRCCRRVRPGDMRNALPADAPETGESFDAIFADFERIVMPGITHWNHPGFFAYFAISGSGPGVLAEFLSAALNVQAMLWRTSPAATELEEVTLGWLRRLDRPSRHLRGRDLRHGLDLDAARARRRARAAVADVRDARPGRRDPTCRGSASTARSTRTRRWTRRSSCSASATSRCGGSRRRGIPDASRRARRRHRRGHARGRPADRGRRHGRHDVDDQRRSGWRDRGDLRARADLAPRRCRIRRRRGDAPGHQWILRDAAAADSVVSIRTSGCSRRSISASCTAGAWTRCGARSRSRRST